MAQHYYGIQRSDEYLAHYGVRGMKWGVRKAIERGDRAALGHHYLKAQRKLAKLTEQANTGRGIGSRRAAIGALTSAALSGAGTYAINRIQGASPLNAAKTAGLAAVAGGAGGGILNSGRATRAEMMNARARRDAWKREMDRTFKGTGAAKAAKAMQTLPDRLGPNSSRIGRDTASGVRYVDLRPNSKRRRR